MTDLMIDAPAVIFCSIYCGLSPQHALESLRETENPEWLAVAAEHTRLVAEAVKAARMEALREALDALNGEAAYWNQQQHIAMRTEWTGLRDAIQALITATEDEK